VEDRRLYGPSIVSIEVLLLTELHRCNVAEFSSCDRLLRNERYLSLNECEVIGDSQQSSMVTTIHASRLLSDRRKTPLNYRLPCFHLQAVPGSSRKIMSGNSQGEVVGFSDQVNPRNMGPFRVTDGLRRYQWRSFNFASSVRLERP
jgi:hypothetical protein